MDCNCRNMGDCDGSCQHPEPPVCKACDGSGVEVFGITVHEHGCGFSHDSTDERPCKECGGSGHVGWFDHAEGAWRTENCSKCPAPKTEEPF